MRSHKLAHPLPSGMRDLLPGEAARRRKLARRLLDNFALHGYSLVTPPAFELSEVLERGLGTLDPGDVLRFVEPESGEVAALRPDMTPQIARMAGTRLADLPKPMRLCYEGTVLRRRQERARKHRQIPQAGVELLGVGAPEGDVELLALASSTLKAAGLEHFVLDMGHAEIARALVAELPQDLEPQLLDALSHKDASRIEELVARSGAKGPSITALRELPRLHGDRDVFREAERLLRETKAAPAFDLLRDLYDRMAALGLASSLRVDFGEVRGFAYYTGVVFHLLAEGPGEPLGSGGRYDELLSRFGAPMPAAGFALDLDNVAWALLAAGKEERLDTKILVQGERAEAICVELRRAKLPCLVLASGDADAAESYARAWDCSHLLLESDGLTLTDLTTSEPVRFSSLDEIAAWLSSP